MGDLFIFVTTKRSFTLILEATMMGLVANSNAPSGKLAANRFLTQRQAVDGSSRRGPVNRRAVRNGNVMVALPVAEESRCKEGLIEGKYFQWKTVFCR